MFVILAVILVLAWALGFGVFHVGGALVHFLIILALISVIVHFARGRRVVEASGGACLDPGPRSRPRANSKRAPARSSRSSARLKSWHKLTQRRADRRSATPAKLIWRFRVAPPGPIHPVRHRGVDTRLGRGPELGQGVQRDHDHLVQEARHAHRPGEHQRGRGHRRQDLHCRWSSTRLRMGHVPRVCLRSGQGHLDPAAGHASQGRISWRDAPRGGVSAR